MGGRIYGLFFTGLDPFQVMGAEIFPKKPVDIGQNSGNTEIFVICCYFIKRGVKLMLKKLYGFFIAAMGGLA